MKTKLAKAAAPIYAALLQNPANRYVRVADQAKLVRAALADQFPTTTFSVRSKSYSGGASISVNWTDGPTTEDVEKITKGYTGGGFDGMIDLAFSKSRWLSPDGRTALAHSQGTAGSGGTYSEQIGSAHHPDAIEVHFLGDYIFAYRSYSDERRQEALDHLRATRASVSELDPAPQYIAKTFGNTTYRQLDRDPMVDGEWLSIRINRELYKRDFTVQTATQ